MSSPRVLVCGAWDEGAGYPRPRSLVAALREAEIGVAEVRAELWLAGREKQRVAASPARWPAVALRVWRQRGRFARRVNEAVREHRPHAILIPYPGHLVAPWVRAAYSGPILLDLFLSAYDTTVEDRARFRPGSLAARALRHLDRRACRAADLVALDTPQHARHVASLVGLPEARFGWVQVTDPEAPDSAPPYQSPSPGGPLEVLFFGTGVPLHGFEVLVRAVSDAPGVQLTAIGATEPQRRTASGLLGSRLRLLEPFVGRDVLDREIARAHVVAGVFSDRPKARRVVPLKVVHGLAAGRPVLTADTPAIREFTTPGEDCLVWRSGGRRLAA